MFTRSFWLVCRHCCAFSTTATVFLDHDMSVDTVVPRKMKEWTLFIQTTWIWGERVCSALPEVHDDLHGLCVIEHQVVGWRPCRQCHGLVPVIRHLPAEIRPITFASSANVTTMLFKWAGLLEARCASEGQVRSVALQECPWPSNRLLCRVPN